MSHLQVDGALVGSLLRERGLRSDRITPEMWRSHLRGQHATFPLFVRVGRDGYITFAIVPFVRSPKSPARATALYRRLLELNQDLLMAKFSIDDDLDVVLSVEYPTEALDETEFDDALTAMAFYADRYFSELRELA